MSAEGHPLYDGLARRVVRRRWLAIAAMLAVTAGAVVPMTTRLYVDNSLEAFMGEDPSQDVLEELRDAFGREDVFVVVVEGDVFSRSYIEKLAAMHKELTAMDLDLPTLGQRKRQRDQLRHGESATAAPPPVAAEPDEDDAFGAFEDLSGEPAGWGDTEGGTVVDEIVSLANVRRVVSDEKGIAVTKWLDPIPSDAELPAIREGILAEPSLVGRLVSSDGRYSTLVIRTQFMDEPDMNRVYQEIVSITDRYASDDFRPGVAGQPAIQGSVYVLMMRDVTLMTTLVFVLVALILFAIFRSALGVIAPLLVVTASLVWMFATGAALGWPMTFATNALPPFIIAVGVCEAIHVQTVCEDLRRSGLDNESAIRKAIAVTGLPCLLTSVTTSVGLVSFNFSGLDSIKHMGTMAALGSMYAYVLTMVLLPALLTFRRGRPRARRGDGSRDLIDGVIATLTGLSKRPRDRWIVIGGFALAGVVAMVVTVQRYEIEHNPLTWIPQDHPVVEAIDTVDDHLSGSVDITLLIEPKGPDGLSDPELLAGIERVEREVLAYEHPERGRMIGGSMSVLDALRETNRALHAGDQQYYRIPTDQRAISDQLFLFENSARDDFLRVVTPNHEKTQLTFLSHWIQIAAFKDVTDFVDAVVARNIDPEKAEVRGTGYVYGIAAVLAGLIQDMFESFGAACLVIAVLMVLLFRSLKLGVLALIPNILPIILVLGFAIGIGLPVDWTNAMVGSLIIGIVVDDTIHFFHHFKHHYAATGDTEESLDECMRVAGRANVGTAFTVAGAFLVMLFASMLNLRKFGILVAASVVAALLCELVLGPALLRTFYRNKRINQPEVR